MNSSFSFYEDLSQSKVTSFLSLFPFLLLSSFLIIPKLTFSLFIFLAEINDYATLIGIDPTKETHLLYLAKEGLMAALPPEWKIW